MVSQGVLFLPTAVILGSSGGKEEILHAKSLKNEAELLALLNWDFFVATHVLEDS